VFCAYVRPMVCSDGCMLWEKYLVLCESRCLLVLQLVRLYLTVGAASQRRSIQSSMCRHSRIYKSRGTVGGHEG
jgi:hypothetical protein